MMDKQNVVYVYYGTLLSFENSGTCYKVDETKDMLSAVSQSVKGQYYVSCLVSQAHRGRKNSGCRGWDWGNRSEVLNADRVSV